MSDAERAWTILRVLNWTAERFAREGMASPRLDAEVLLAHALSVERIRLYMDHDKPLRPDELARVRELVRRRLAHEPVAYLTGVREFWSLPIRVDGRALIPRPETESLIEVARLLMRDVAAPLVVDVGTGSGAIPLALERELPGARLIGIDVSRDALALARENFDTLGSRAELLEGDLLDALPPELRPNLIVSNLPYVPSPAVGALAREIREWEPAIALDGGDDGLQLIRRLAAQAAARLARPGWLVLEIGLDQSANVSKVLRSAGFDEIRVHRDLAGVERVVAGRRS